MTWSVGFERTAKHGSPDPSDQCVQRANGTASDCVEKRDSHDKRTYF